MSTSSTSAIIFDLDGTLLDTLGSLAEAFNLALADLDCPPHPTDAYRQIIGDGARVAAARALPVNRQQDHEIDHCVNRFQSHYSALWRSADIYPGIHELLNRLGRGYQLAVLSNKDQAFTHQCCEAFFPGRFDAVIGFSESVKHKPDPSGALLIGQQLGVDISQCWMIGDTSTDMQTAMAAGMTGIGVLWGFRDRTELENHGASHIISSPAELLHLPGLKETAHDTT